MRFLSAIFFVSITVSLFGQSSRLTFFPDNSIRKKIILDPVESQNSISFTHLAVNDTIKETMYVPTAIGFYKPIFQHKNLLVSEFGVDVVALTQFGIKRAVEDPYYTAKYQLNLLNVDYKLSLLYTILKNNITYRLRLYHLSSHLGDDYLLRYGYDTQGYWLNNPRNYEQLDFFMFYKNLNFDYFFGTGFVISPNTKRKRLSFQGGLNLYFPINKKVNLFSGMFLSSMQETGFSPSAKMSLGIDLKREFKMILEYYEGNMPYSTFESIDMTYVGIGFYLSDL